MRHRVHWTDVLGPTEVRTFCGRWVRGVWATNVRSNVTCKRCRRRLAKERP
ncbi:hypothetical protein LCGC14_1600390 [marine sediment metagenome]|uniref:Uncharacterized protein n=1 Tax=marine sediment metagenome TaxID=412755 RepID=A0A0F9IBN2_9ZZZZ